MTDADTKALANLLSHHHATPDQIERMAFVRQVAETFATVIVEHSPRSADRASAIRHVGVAMMESNRAIVTEGEAVTV